ncbi:MAG: hypothetical protein LBQ82_08410 [Treponema sp.]|nr:hypothetical protein [Treponema sp.]
MRQINFLRKIILFISFALLVLSCDTRKNHDDNTEFGLTAEAVPEGILLTISNIPQDATHLWISVSSWGDTEEPESPNSIIYSYAAITDTSVWGVVNSTQNLDKIKQTGKVIFPIVEAGTKYSCSATIYNEREINLIRENDENVYPRTAYAQVIADNGIYFNREDVKLEINNAHSVVTISCEPEFSSKVIFDDQKYRFGVTISVGNNSSMGVADHHIPAGLSSDGLTWEFEPQMTDALRSDSDDGGWLEIGSNYSAWAEVYANIIYDDIKWSVGIAKTPEFIYSLK